jgi:O-methyltransferase
MKTWNAERLDLFKEVLTGANHPESAWLSLGAAAWSGTKGPAWKRFFGRVLHRMLARRGWELVKRKAYDAGCRERGEDWPLVGYSMAGRRRLTHLQGCVETVAREGVPGDFLETGVWRGGACMWMKAVLEGLGDTGRTIWLADSFAGLPRPVDAATAGI